MFCYYHFYYMETDTTEPVDMPKATLKIDPITRDRLAKLGAKGDTFDNIIVMLLYEHDLLAAIARDHPEIVQHKPRSR